MFAFDSLVFSLTASQSFVLMTTGHDELPQSHGLQAVNHTAHEECRKFIEYVNAPPNKRLGYDGCGRQKPYMTDTMLHEYWSKDDRIEEVLRLTGVNSITAAHILENYLRIFSILCYIDRPYYLADFKKRFRTNESLPFTETSMPIAWQGPESDSLREVYHRCIEVQWRFNPHVFDVLDASRPVQVPEPFPKEQILAIDKRKPLTEARADATMWLVSASPSQFVFKEYGSDGENYWRAENKTYDDLLNAHRRLKDQRDDRGVPSVLDYFANYCGSFRHESEGDQKSCVIVLEHITGGTLEDYVLKNAEDLRKDETARRQLWKQLWSNTLRGLELLHDHAKW